MLDVLNVEAELTLSSTALPAPIRLLVRLAGQFPSGSESFEGAYVSLSSFPCGTSSLYSPGDFVRECGDWGVDLSGFEAASIDVYESHFDAYSGYVVFRIRGVIAPGCTPGPEGLSCSEDASGEIDVATVGELRLYFE